MKNIEINAVVRMISLARRAKEADAVILNRLIAVGMPEPQAQGLLDQG